MIALSSPHFIYNADGFEGKKLKLVHAEKVLAINLKRKADADEQKKNSRPPKVSSSAISLK